VLSPLQTVQCLAIVAWLTWTLPALALPPDATATDPLPTVDHQPESTTSLDAEVRFRGSTTSHLGDLQAGQDDVRHGVFDRLRLGAQFHREQLSAYLQLQNNGALGDAAPGEQPLPIGLQQGYVRLDVPGVKGMRLDAGRMALEFGAARMIGRYDFHDTGNAFDGLRLRMGIDDFLDVDLLAVKIRRNSAHPDKERNLAGMYVTGLPVETLRADLYFLYLGDNNEAGQAHILTMGLRLDWRATSFLALEAETALQVGDVQPNTQDRGLDHLASALAGTLTLDGRNWLPLLVKLHGQMYAGDAAPGDNLSAGWRPLYPSLDEIVGLLQIFRQDNLSQAGARLRWQLGAPLALDVDGFASWSRTGAPLPGFADRVLPGDGAWVLLGPEVDVRLRWTWRPWSELMLAGGVFIPATSLREHLGTATARQVLLQWTSRF
jgi:hypothetical protein